MQSVKVYADPSASELVEGFRRIRRGMGLAESFPAAVQREAERVALRPVEPGPGRADRTDLDLVTIDPPGSRDLDQAFYGQRTAGGYRVHYAIADLGHFVDPGSELEAESLRRGATLYSPDTRTPLYPPVLGEGAASLLPGVDRPAVLWTIDVDPAGWVRSTVVDRAIVRSRQQMTYEQAQRLLDSEAGGESLEVMREVGSARLRIEEERGGVDLRIPEQQINKTAGGFELAYRSDHSVERWNAQISLMTGIAAASMMLRNGTGLLRTLPPPAEETLAGLRASAAVLGLEWPRGLPYQAMVRRQSPADPRSAAFLAAARVLFRGAGYQFFTGEPPDQANHYAVAAPYAHVTAPLRRMADRLCNELLLAGGREAPDWLVTRLADAPEVMKQAERRARELESRIVDYVEARLLAGRLGDEFDATVVQCGGKGCVVQLASPAVLATAEGEGRLGERVRVRLTSADPESGKVRFDFL